MSQDWFLEAVKETPSASLSASGDLLESFDVLRLVGISAVMSAFSLRVSASKFPHFLGTPVILD